MTKFLIKQKAFIFAFLTSYFFFFFITIAVLDIKVRGPIAGSVYYGYPYTYYSSHCFGGGYSYEGLIANMAIASLIGTIVGLSSSWTIHKALPDLSVKLRSEEFAEKWSNFKRKWYL